MQIHESLDAIRDQLCECLEKYPTLRVTKLFQSDVPQDVLRGHLGRSIAEYTQTLYEEPPLTSDGQAYREVLDSWIYFPGQTGLPSELGILPHAAIREHEDRCLGEIQSVFGRAAALLYSGSFQEVQGVLGTIHQFARWDHWLNALFIVAKEDTIDVGLQVIDQTETIIANCRSTCATHNWDALEDAGDFEAEILCGCDKTELRGGWIHVLEPSIFAASIQLVDYLRGSLPAGKGTAETPEQPTNSKLLSDAKKPTAPKMTAAMANEKAMELAKQDPRFVKKNQRDWADAIGCSAGLVGKTTLWQETMSRTERGRKGQGIKPKKVSLTKAIEETVGEGTEHDVLKKLIAEQESDYEPSSLDSKGRNPISRDDG